MRALVAGHVCIDLVPALDGDIYLLPGRLEEVGPLTMRAGGCVANTGVALADLGADVRLEALVGADPLGDWLTELVGTLVAPASQLRRMPGVGTSYSVALEPPDSDRMFLHHVGANALFDGTDIELGDAELLHLGYLTLLPGLWTNDAAPARALLERAKAAGLTTSVDLAVVDRRSGVDWPRLLATVLPLVDVISPSVDDLASIHPAAELNGRAGIERTAASLIEQGVAICLITAGDQGMVLRTADTQRLASGGRVLSEMRDQWAKVSIAHDAPLVQIASTVGAGDAATAGLLYGLMAGDYPEMTVELATRAAAHRLAGSWRLPRYADLVAGV
jgi:sugar/nucleoside kinase (ribokinase family)